MTDSAMFDRWLHTAFGAEGAIPCDDLFEVMLTMQADEDGVWTSAPGGVGPEEHATTTLATAQEDVSVPLATSPVVVEPSWLFTEHRIGDDVEVQTPSELFFNGEVGGLLYLCDPETKHPIVHERYPLQMELGAMQARLQVLRGLLPRVKFAHELNSRLLDIMKTSRTPMSPLYGLLVIVSELVLFVLKRVVARHAAMSDEDRDIKLRVIVAEKDPGRSFDNVPR
ncbi:hypothetical protein SPRG_05367 [Saprolegnia parasitica CBS 223.65]|uniref:Uncharacterized protein n=1 Tax=Saprolegnia parasitica (strain CBS 223.65) TaxID=695850 RepID=A0A067CLW1_SAPPC|nr:hypothetical protein SPRG_05367 [Saprolegnia parasitica CBS 223.65]KDO30175.1 hypothetical protein SPRG_05367 [Saprolegnia parasitica CBS 223.65]|eukprot:XP_012199353.1 hypothetical protein SPRG_05367 [Saprolegnia parasitica CBS 223.65]